MGYYNDCRDCIHKNSIHRASNGYDCEFICGYSKKELDDAYGDYPCRCFVDADAVEAAERREQSRRDTEALIAGYMLADHEDDIIPGVFFIGAVIIAVGIWERLCMSDSPIALLIRVIVTLYILYKLVFKWVLKFLAYAGKKIWGKAFHEKLKSFGATMLASLVVTWVFTTVYDIRYFFACFVIFACIIQRYFIRDWLKQFHDRFCDTTAK